jgi:hypothetical protein
MDARSGDARGKKRQPVFSMRMRGKGPAFETPPPRRSLDFVATQYLHVMGRWILMVSSRNKAAPKLTTCPSVLLTY